MPVREAAPGLRPLAVQPDSQRLVLQCLRRLGEASRADLARAAGLTHTAVGQIVARLERAGLLRSAGRRQQGQRGQPAHLVTLEPKGAAALGVRLDRGRIETVLADLSGALLGQRAHDGMLPPPEEALACVRRDVEGLIAALPAARRRRISGIGVARPYNLGSWLATLGLPPDSFTAWDRFTFGDELARATGLPVIEENDGTAAAIAELLHGAGRRQDDFLYVFIGPAVGGGLVLDGQAVRGRTGNAADIGVIPVAPSRLSSAPEAPGGRDILLGRASVAALMRHLRARGETPSALTALPPTEAVAEWLEDCAAALVEPLLAARALLGVPLVVIDGDLPAPLIDRLIARLSPMLRAATAESRQPPALARGSFGATAGALGAASMPLFLQFGPGAGRIGGGPRNRDRIGDVHALTH